MFKSMNEVWLPLTNRVCEKQYKHTTETMHNEMHKSIHPQKHIKHFLKTEEGVTVYNWCSLYVYFKDRVWSVSISLFLLWKWEVHIVCTVYCRCVFVCVHEHVCVCVCVIGQIVKRAED